LWPSCRNEIVGQPFCLPSFDSATEAIALQFRRMKTFGGFRSGNESFYGELRGDEVHRLSQPYWIQVQPTGEILPLANLKIDVPVAPSKLVAVGLNYADHIAEMKRTEIGALLICFRAPTSLLAHQCVLEI